MMSQALQQTRPGRSRTGMGPAIGRTVPLNPGFTGRSAGAGRSARVIAWHPRAQQTPFRRRLATWRERYWRRIVLAWFVLSMIGRARAAHRPALRNQKP